MLLWRIASNVFPTKNRIGRFITLHDNLCFLCKKDNESITHLFLYCGVARALWFGSCWGCKTDELHLENHMQLIYFIINPPQSFLADKGDA